MKMYEDIIGKPKKKDEKIKVELIGKNEDGSESYKVGDQIVRIYKTWADGYKVKA